MNTVDIVIVNYNSTQELLGCIQSIYSCGCCAPYLIHVQDNSPRKDDLKHVLRDFPAVNITENKENLGFAKAVNRALRNGKAPYVLILNPDTIIQPGLIDKVIHYMENHPEVGVLGPKILESDGTVQGSARKFPSLLTALFGRKSILSRILPNNPVTRGNILTVQSDGKTPMPVDWVSGACMLVRRAAIDHVGTLDETFFMYWEDADWCRRMWQGGWHVMYFPLGEVTHHVGVSSETNVFRSVLEFHRSIYRLFDKHAKGSYALLKPAVFWGIVFRFLFVFASQMFRKAVKKSRKEVFEKTAGMHPPDDRRKIRILRFIARLNIGGPSIHVHQLTTGLNPEIFQQTLVTGKISPQEGDMSYLFKPSEPQPMIIEALQRDISPLQDLKAFLHILRLIRLQVPNIVDTHTAKAGTSARLAAMVYNLTAPCPTRTVHTFHGHVFAGYFSRLKSQMFIWIERFLARSTDVIVAISRSQKEDLSKKFRIAPKEKIKIIPLGFDLGPFLSSEHVKGRFRKSMGFGKNILTVGIVGRLVPIKNHALFLDMARIFLKQNPGIRSMFVLVGDGELRGRLESRVLRYDLSEHVHFCGWRKDLPEVYAGLDVLALTSENEGTPVSIIEAMAAGTPVISTRAGGVQDLLGNSNEKFCREGFLVCERGVLCPRNDAGSFARGLKYLVTMNHDEKQAMIQRARAFAVKTFSEERLLWDMEKLYREMV